MSAFGCNPNVAGESTIGRFSMNDRYSSIALHFGIAYPTFDIQPFLQFMAIMINYIMTTAGYCRLGYHCRSNSTHVWTLITPGLLLFISIKIKRKGLYNILVFQNLLIMLPCAIAYFVGVSNQFCIHKCTSHSSTIKFYQPSDRLIAIFRV